MADIERYLNRLNQLDSERTAYMSVWRKVSEYVQPMRGRYLYGDTSQKKPARFNAIIDDEAGRSLRVLAAGLMAGMTSPARPWFRLAFKDPDLNSYQPVKSWLEKTRAIMMRVLAKSNAYRTLHGIYTDLGLFGTSAALFDLDYRTVVHGTQFGAGEYWIDIDDRDRVHRLYREFSMTAEQMAQKFGYEALPKRIRDELKENTRAKHRVVHVVEPREPWEREGKIGALGMPYRSLYFLKSDEDGQVLMESGHRFQRFVAPRWALQTGDIYGHGPAMEVIGSVIDLQRDHRMKRKVIDYRADPPVQIPATMKGKNNLLPGGKSYYNPAEGPQAGIRTAFEVNLDPTVLLESINDTRRRIQQAFFVDIFLMISQMDETRTATEIAARQEEKMLMLGPVLERLHDELLNPLIDIVFRECLEGGLLPPPPEEINQQELTVEYVSVLAQAQKVVNLASHDRMVGMIGTLAQLKPEALDKLNVDRAVDAYADALGVNPDMIVGDDKVALIRQQRAQAQAAMAQQAQQAQQVEDATKIAQAIKTTSEVGQDKINDAISLYASL